jgi:hypothetical protein
MDTKKREVHSWFVMSIFAADSSSRVGVTATLSSVNNVATRLNGGDLCTSAPDGAGITIEGPGWFESQNSSWYVEPVERVREVYDILAMPKGESGSTRKCMDCFREYQTDPSSENRKFILRIAFDTAN